MCRRSWEEQGEGEFSLKTHSHRAQSRQNATLKCSPRVNLNNANVKPSQRGALPPQRPMGHSGQSLHKVALGALVFSSAISHCTRIPGFSPAWQLKLSIPFPRCQQHHIGNLCCGTLNGGGVNLSACMKTQAGLAEDRLVTYYWIPCAWIQVVCSSGLCCLAFSFPPLSSASFSLHFPLPQHALWDTVL